MTFRRKLIEVALPLEAINIESAREKSIRHGHPSTLHLWWARRPLAACRAVLFAQLVDDPDQPGLSPALLELLDQLPAPAEERLDWDTLSLGEQRRYRLFALIEKLVKWENINDETLLEQARALIRASAGPEGPPPLLDPFAGGGSIPLEAQRLGLEAHASDLNPVAVLINKALIEIPPKFAGQPPVHPQGSRGAGRVLSLSKGGQRSMFEAEEWRGAKGLAEDVRYYGQWMRDEAEKRIGHLYPKVKLPAEYGGGEATVIAWLWARTVPSPNPAANGAPVPLVRSFALSTKKGKETWVEPVIDRQKMTYRFEIRSGKGKPPEGTVNRKGGVCLLTGAPMPFDHIRAEGKAGRMGARLMAIVAEGSSGRIYLPPTPEHEAVAAQAQPQNVPDTDLPEQALGFRVQLYGMAKHRDLFTLRQLTALTTFSDLVSEARERVRQDALAAWGKNPPPQPSPVGGGGNADSFPWRGEVGREENIWTPHPIPRHLLEAARRLRREMTDAEQLLWQCLRRKQLDGFRFRKQHPLQQFVLDFYCPEARLAVELDGGQHNTPAGTAADSERTAILEQHGIEVIRFWNNEVFTNLEGVLQTIYEALLKRVSRQMPPPQPSPAGGESNADPSPRWGEVGWGENSLATGLPEAKAVAYAKAVATYLAFLVDKIAEATSTICTWSSAAKNELVVSTFRRQAIPMTWDFAEANPFASSSGSFESVIEYLVKVITKLPAIGISRIKQHDATNAIEGIIYPSISTDPPYYDNIGYADLSDFFYVWLRCSLKDVYPDLFSTLLVPKTPELVATPYRFNDEKQKAQQFFEEGLGHAFVQMRGVGSS